MLFAPKLLLRVAQKRSLHLQRFPITPKFALVWYLIASLLLTPIISLGSPVQASAKLAELKEQIEQNIDQFRSYADRYSLLDQLDFDADSLAQFFQSSVALDVYPGVLRGIDGTLQGRSGNAYDQSLALASLLKDIGYDAQILETTLTAEQAAAVVMYAGAAKTEIKESAPLQFEFVDELLSQLREETESLSALQSDAQSIAASVYQSALQGGQLKSTEQLDHVLLASAGTYYWVRFRLAEGAPWEQTHPAWPMAEGLSLEFENILTDKVPDADLHKVALEVFIETTRGRRASVTGSWQMASALVEDSIELSISSSAAAAAAEGAKDGTLDQALEQDSNFFFVKINGALTPNGLVFDRQGNTYPGDSLDGINTVFSTLATKGQAVAAQFGAISSDVEKKDQADALQRVWLELSSIAPDGDVERVVRNLYVKDGEHGLGRFANLHQIWNIAPLTTDRVPGYFSFHGAQDLGNVVDMMQRLLDGSLSESRMTRLSSELYNRETEARLRQYDQWASRFQLDASQKSYRGNIGLVAVRRGVLENADGEWSQYTMTDILTNRRYAIRYANAEFIVDKQLAVERGVWETMGESVTGRNFQSDFVRSAFAELRDSSLTSDGKNTQAWWQVDPSTGSTIGMLRTPVGLGGAEMGEHALTVVTLSLSILMASVGQYACVSGGGTVNCCLAVNGGLFIVGLCLGTLIGAYGVAVGGASAGAAAIPFGFIFDAVGLVLPIDCS
ncbi:MAG: hypothetical protein AAGI44_00765 [Pseudomonadota bacterium]